MPLLHVARSSRDDAVRPGVEPNGSVFSALDPCEVDLELCAWRVKLEIHDPHEETGPFHGGAGFFGARRSKRAPRLGEGPLVERQRSGVLPEFEGGVGHHPKRFGAREQLVGTAKERPRLSPEATLVLPQRLHDELTESLLARVIRTVRAVMGVVLRGRLGVHAGVRSW
ncbi:MAG TPA: hypothetical protein RMG95_08620 [Polyangiaceae bacterium LLY-WYZ-15_(1-7)]|nr:hypothetical protein [Polyangiaceae bacterium LLY-WYZ-15_(1-7)]